MVKKYPSYLRKKFFFNKMRKSNFTQRFVKLNKNDTVTKQKTNKEFLDTKARG